MSSINELTRATQWLYTTLIGGLVASRVYEGIAPAGTDGPYIVYSLQSPGNDVIVVGGARITATPLFLVKAVAKVKSWSTLAPIADQIDTRLHDASGTVTGGVILSSMREQPFSLIEVTDGVQYQHLGGLYRIRVQAVGA